MNNPPTFDEFCAVMRNSIPDLGDPLPLQDFLGGEYAYYASEVWPSGRFLNLPALAYKIMPKYRSSHAERTLKTPPKPRVKATGQLSEAEEYQRYWLEDPNPVTIVEWRKRRC